MKKKSLLFKISIASFAVIIILTSVCALYLGDYYRASEDAVSAFAVQNPFKMIRKCAHWTMAPFSSSLLLNRKIPALSFFIPEEKLSIPLTFL